ncbi:hypothetical protein SG34_011485 [Thalassomonas viridans]|uniref:Uncharacterized protein n=1 Tax=Thalassomonas viridans TaxID=137584 RepID=A0AAE9Z645_9GAMM|nr:hypothetical protein [Thalassomonas viridans]WDE07451.1 hypothetical protein SG34_011485 [Thalassomonas viridans]
MKLKLNKKKLKNLSKDSKTIPAAMTPHVAGGTKGPELETIAVCDPL